MKKEKIICWDKPCNMKFPICCFDCEAFDGCPEACDQLGCREKMKGDEDEED